MKMFLKGKAGSEKSNIEIVIDSPSQFYANDASSFGSALIMVTKWEFWL